MSEMLIGFLNDCSHIRQLNQSVDVIFMLCHSAASTMSQLLSSTTVAMSSTNLTTVTTSLTTTSSANAGSGE